MNKGIPTIYRDVQYRSRLEAKWAAMFDLLGWSYQYEPFDLPGWVPDFSITAKDEAGYMLVEVKPFMREKDFNVEKIFTAVDEGVKDGTIQHEPEILLLGLTPILVEECQECHADFQIGWLIARDVGDDGGFYIGSDGAYMNHYGGEFGLIAGWGSWFDRITGLYSGNGFVMPAARHEVEAMWAQASNSVQWRSPR